jgi:hypothetical protein
MTADFQPPPPPCVKAQAAALRAAFPGYVVNVIVSGRGDEPRYEVVSRDGGNPYCLMCATMRTAVSPAERAWTGGGVCGPDGLLVI